MDQLVRHASELHAASGVASSILELTQRDDFVVQELVSLIEHDPALTARVLSTVNSCRFGLSRQISNLQQAVTLLGRRSLRNIALSFSVVNAFAHEVDRNVYRDYWRRSLTTSLVADRLSRRFPNIDANDAYVSGLLADIGILALAQFEPDAYLPVSRNHPHGPELVAAERQAFGFHHAEFGARLLEIWQFPPLLSSAVAKHHDDTNESQELSLDRFVHAGNPMPDAIWLARTTAFQDAFVYFERYFDFEIPEFIDFALHVNQAVAEEAELFQIGGIHPVDDETLEVIKEGLGLEASRA